MTTFTRYHFVTAIEAGGGKFKSKREGVAEGTVVKGKFFHIRYHDLSMGGTEITRDEAEDRGVDITARVNVNFVYIFSTKESDLPKPKAEKALPSQGRRHSEASLPATASNPMVEPLLPEIEEGPVFLTGPNALKRAESTGP
mmetsp:Transcript_9137/g.22726  ORF Transcript_9137/g.22726 Transcript_9137/m.22726 type:complete len:142 (-) Transcript_9137:86-511(-)|eukprot:CAMPEP_0119473922 /NCGR_PEP_ID=MMETSP1344-20130328/5389_1 /TAXON_ID=236787 /ORGANISM="Florenciella parvula, Strain CCMP2471" /LENGTH=141 /DNA_ID=CAMNT_0007507131 /DNA_START=625 /DNA_END=1050 /DNA_ORIENTATION=+